MESQVSRLIDAMEGLSPDAARIWSEMVVAESTYNVLMLCTSTIPIMFFGLAFLFYKAMKNKWTDTDLCGIGIILMAIAGSISFAIVVSAIPEWITGAMNPEATLAYSIIINLK